MSYLDRLKDKYCPTEALTKPTEAPFVSSVSTLVGQKKASDHLSQQDPHPIALWWRIAITEPSGQIIEVDTPSGWTLADWQAYAARYHGPGCTVTSIAGRPKARAPVNLEEALAAACDGVAITPEVFRSLLSLEDVADIAAGGVHSRTLGAYAQSFAEGLAAGRIVVPGGEP